MLVHHRSGDQPVDVLVAKELDRAPFGGVAPLATHDEEHVAPGFRVRAYSSGYFAVVRIVVLLDYERDATVSPRRFRAPLLGWSIIEELDGGEHAIPRIGLDGTTVVEHSGHGRLRDPRLPSNVRDSGALSSHSCQIGVRRCASNRPEPVQLGSAEEDRIRNLTCQDRTAPRLTLPGLGSRVLRTEPR